MYDEGRTDHIKPNNIPPSQNGTYPITLPFHIRNPGETCSKERRATLSRERTFLTYMYTTQDWREGERWSSEWAGSLWIPSLSLEDECLFLRSLSALFKWVNRRLVQAVPLEYIYPQCDVFGWKTPMTTTTKHQLTCLLAIGLREGWGEHEGQHWARTQLQTRVVEV